jgi:hypothetical protein
LALSGSLVLHALAGLLLWWAFGSATWVNHNGKIIVDTRVAGSDLDWDVCLQLDDGPRVKPKKVSAAPIQPPPSPANQPKESVAGNHSPDLAPGPVISLSREPSISSSPFSAISSSGENGSLLGQSGVWDGRGPDETIAFFEIGVPAGSVVYVIDRSASMGLRGALGLAKQELLASLEKLPAETRFQIIIYNRLAECLKIGGRTDLVPASLENKREVVALLESVRPEGSTDPLPALRRALALRPEVIFFLTDADDFDVRQVAALTQLNHGRTAIHSIEMNTLHRNRDDLPLQVLARNNRGQYRAIAVSER